MISICEVTLKVLFKKDISAKESLYRFSRLLNFSFSRKEELCQMHQAREFKKYCFDNPYPLEPTKIYKENNIYSIRIRTIDDKLFNYFWTEMPGFENDDFRIVAAYGDIVPQRPLESIRSITPAIIKTESGYWENTQGVDFFLNALNGNMLRKYEFFTGEKIERNKVFFFDANLQEKPCTILYKKALLFGNKLELLIKEDQLSQNIAHLALGVGICENNTAGTGFMEYQWVKRKRNNLEKAVIKC